MRTRCRRNSHKHPHPLLTPRQCGVDTQHPVELARVSIGIASDRDVVPKKAPILGNSQHTHIARSIAIQRHTSAVVAACPACPSLSSGRSPFSPSPIPRRSASSRNLDRCRCVLRHGRWAKKRSGMSMWDDGPVSDPNDNWPDPPGTAFPLFWVGQHITCSSDLTEVRAAGGLVDSEWVGGG